MSVSDLQFVDTNVLLYAYDASAGNRHEAAADLISDLGKRRRAAVSIQVLQEFYVNATRKIAEPLEPEGARARIRVFSLWPVHVPQVQDVIAAAEIAQTNSLSFWDAMVVRSAGVLGCRVLWSEDLNDGQSIGDVTVRNLFDRQ